MSIKSIISKGRKFDSAVGRTVVEQAKEIAQDIWTSFSNVYSEDNAKEYNAKCQEVGDGIGGEVGARVSEWKKFAMAVPYGMAEALNEMPAELLTRTRMFQLARRVHAAADYMHVKETVAAYVDEINNPKPGKGSKATVASHVKAIFNVTTRRKQDIAFRKALVTLCKEHGYEI